MPPTFRDMVRNVRARLLLRRRDAYRTLFGGGPHGKLTPAQIAVLADLKRFCHADYPTFDPDARVHALREGRREVWIRIQHHLQLSDRQIADLKEISDDDFE